MHEMHSVDRVMFHSQTTMAVDHYDVTVQYATIKTMMDLVVMEE